MSLSENLMPMYQAAHRVAKKLYITHNVTSISVSVAISHGDAPWVRSSAYCIAIGLFYLIDYGAKITLWLLSKRKRTEVKRYDKRKSA